VFLSLARHGVQVAPDVVAEHVAAIVQAHRPREKGDAVVVRRSLSLAPSPSIGRLAVGV
jgi:hypothetical protein